MEKFMGKYRIPSARAQWWDYSNNGSYFVTICTENRECFFGDIINKEFNPSELGELASHFLYRITDQFPFIELGPAVVMPNHVHVIIKIIHPANGNKFSDDVSEKGGFAGIKNPMLNDNLSRVIRWYKGVCSWHMRKIHANFAWQPRFYDVIIKNEEEYTIKCNYINNNIAKWETDKFFKRVGYTHIR